MTSSIRLAIESDIPQILEMGHRFHEQTGYQKHVKSNPAQMLTLTKQIIAVGGLLVSERDGQLVGMIGFVVYPHFISAEIVAGEVFWWVEPQFRGDGLRLLREAEKKAQEYGATRMQMIAPTEQVGKVYQRLGYDFVESAYQRSL